MIPISTFDYDAVPDGTMVFGVISVFEVAEYFDPLETPPWVGVPDPIFIEDIQEAIAEGNLVHHEVGTGASHIDDFDQHDPGSLSQARRLHIGRIAAMVVNPPLDCISIAVGIPHLGHSIDGGLDVMDGNHRLAAALIRQVMNPDQTVWIEMEFDGAYYAFAELFPNGFVRTEVMELEDTLAL